MLALARQRTLVTRHGKRGMATRKQSKVVQTYQDRVVEFIVLARARSRDQGTYSVFYETWCARELACGFLPRERRHVLLFLAFGHAFTDAEHHRTRHPAPI